MIDFFLWRLFRGEVVVLQFKYISLNRLRSKSQNSFRKVLANSWRHFFEREKRYWNNKMDPLRWAYSKIPTKYMICGWLIAKSSLRCNTIVLLIRAFNFCFLKVHKSIPKVIYCRCFFFLRQWVDAGCERDFEYISVSHYYFVFFFLLLQIDVTDLKSKLFFLKMWNLIMAMPIIFQIDCFFLWIVWNRWNASKLENNDGKLLEQSNRFCFSSLSFEKDAIWMLLMYYTIRMISFNMFSFWIYFTVLEWFYDKSA